jgi:IS30 family transposase
MNLQKYVLNQMQCHYWTPEQIAGSLKNRQSDLKSVSHETIYAWLYNGSLRKEKYWKFLTRRKAKRGLRKSLKFCKSRIPNRTSIHDRPKIVDEKQDFGHWEGDLMSFMKNTQYILVLRERITMLTLSVVLRNKTAIETAQAVNSLLRKIPKKARKTLTFDNGTEFTNHGAVSKKLGLDVYFCDAYASWQKGGIENSNGRLRRDLPRNTNVKTMKKEEFDEILDNYNDTPRKNLKWFTPNEVFHKKLICVAVTSHKGNQGKGQSMPFARPYYMGVIRVKVGSYFRRSALKISTLPLTRL